MVLMLSKAPLNKSLDNKTLSNKFWKNIENSTNKSRKPLLPLRKNATNEHSQPAKGCTT